MNVMIDSRSGLRGEYADWVKRFEDIWAGGRTRLNEFMTLFGEDITLSAPGLRTTRGSEECHLAFARTFAILPDLTATVHRWAAHADGLFIEMTFVATIGGRRTEWRNIDRFIFRSGIAVERHAYYNPTRVRRAFLSHPKGWLQLLKRIRSGL